MREKGDETYMKYLFEVIFLVLCSVAFLSSCNKQRAVDNISLCEPFIGKPSTWIERGFDACGGSSYIFPYSDQEEAKSHLNKSGVCVYSIRKKIHRTDLMDCGKEYNGTYFFAKVPAKHLGKATRVGWE